MSDNPSNPKKPNTPHEPLDRASLKGQGRRILLGDESASVNDLPTVIPPTPAELPESPLETPAWLLSPEVDDVVFSPKATLPTPTPNAFADEVVFSPKYPQSVPTTGPVLPTAIDKTVEMSPVPLPVGSDQNMEAIPPNEIGSTRQVDLSGINRVVQGHSTTLIPHNPEAIPTQAATRPPQPIAATPPNTDNLLEAIPLQELQNAAQRQINLEGLNRVTQGTSINLVPHDPETFDALTAEATTPPPIPSPTIRPEYAATYDIPHAIPDEYGGGTVSSKGITPAQILEAIGATIDSLSTGTGPTEPPAPRLRSTELFPPTAPADSQLLNQFVDDKRLYELWDMIEALQEDIIEHTLADRSMTDTYQQELLRASELILQGRDNYDDARAIVYRIRGDLKRDRKIQADSAKFRPMLLLYFSGWAIGLIVMALLTGVIVDITETLDVRFFAHAYIPSILGAFGGLLTAYLTLHRHTTVQRDFDAIHVPWYLFTPLVGGLMGFLTFLLLIAGIETTVNADVLESESSITNTGVVLWLLAFLAGMNQNVVVNIFRSRRGSINDEATPSGLGKTS